MSKPRFPRLRQKGAAFYFDTQSKPRAWIPLGSDPVVAMERYRRLMATKGAAGTVQRMVADYLIYLVAGGRGSFGKPVSRGTLEMYRTWSRHLSVFGLQDPTEVTQGDIALYLHRCKRTSARGEISLLSSAYQHAMNEGTLAFNPCIGVRSNRPRSRRDRYITDDELARIREHSSQTLQVAIDLAYLTGLRISDLLAARWDQFGAADGYVENVKTGVRQRFEATEDRRAVLEAARSLQGRIGSLYVLSGRAGQPLNRYTLGGWWRAACKAAGVENAHWHDIRAKAGTDEDAAGGDAQKTLGHSSAQTTRDYLRGKRILTIEQRRKKG